MAKVKLFSFVKTFHNTVIASVRIAKFVSEELSLPIVSGDDVAEEPLDTLVIVNGAYAFSKSLEALGAAIVDAKRVIWIQNDYTIIPPKPTSEATSPFRKAFVDRRKYGKPDTEYWSTCEDWAKLPGSSYVNWNALTFDPDCDEGILKRRRKEATDDLFYYGSWRSDGKMGKEGYRTGKNGREKYFDRYFKKPLVPVVVSTPVDHFKDKYGDAITVIPQIKLDFYGTLGRHGAGLYIEDRMSHERFHSPANRFYEMLSSGLPMIFQPECGTMLRKAGYNPDQYTASSPTEVQRALENREKFGRSQRSEWGEKAYGERTSLSATIKKLWRAKS